MQTNNPSRFIRTGTILGLSIAALLSAPLMAGDPVPNTFSSGDTVSASEMNANFTNLSDRAWNLSGVDLSYSGGNVGIGTTTPGKILDIVGDNNAIRYLEHDVPENEAFLIIGQSSSAAGKLVPFIGMKASPNTSNHIYAYSSSDVASDPPALIISGIYQDNSFNQDAFSNRSILRIDNAYPSHINYLNILEVTADGKVGIGTTSPLSTLQLGKVSSSEASNGELVLARSSGSSENRKFKLGLDSNYGLSIGDFGNSVDDTYTPHMTIRYAGNVGIGTTSPASKLEVSGTVMSTHNNSTSFKVDDFSFYAKSSNPGIGLFDTNATNGFVISGSSRGALDIITADEAGNGSAMVSILNDGKVGIGTTSPTFPLEMASGAHVTTGGVWTNASSRKFKKNIETLQAADALQAIDQLQPVTFKYNNGDQESYVGFIAEDVPELVASGDRQSLSPMDIVAALTKVVQVQQAQLQQLNAEIRELKQATVQ